MRRVGIIAAAILAVLVVAIAAALVIATQTPLGLRLADRVSRPVIERLVREQLGSDVVYAPLEGSLPERLVVRDLTLSQDGEAWARVPEFSFAWKPWDLLTREVHVSAITLTDAALLRLPDLPPADDEAERNDTDDGSGDAGGWIPDIRLDRAAVTGFTLGEAVLGQAYTLSVVASARYLGPELRFELRASSADGTDSADIEGRFDGAAAELDARVRSTPDGLLSRAIGAGGATDIEMFAAGALADLTAEVSASAGAYGAVDGLLYGAADWPLAVLADLSYRPGTVLPEDVRPLIGEELFLIAEAAYDGEEVTLDITELAAAFGAISGNASARTGDNLSARLALEGTTGAEALAPFGAERLAGPFRLTADAAATPDGYGFSADLAAAGLSLSIAEGRSTPEELVAGFVTLRADGLVTGDQRLDPLLEEGLSASGSLAYREGGTATLDGLDAVLGTTPGRRLTLQGDARYDTTDGALAADAVLRAGPSALALLAGGAAFDGPLTVRATASGTADLLSLEAEADLPGGRLEDTSFVPGTLRADVGGLPSRPSGQVTLRSDDGQYRGDLAFFSAGTAVEVSRLDLAAGPVSARGGGRLDLATRAASARLSLDLGRRTRLFTGQTVGGALDLVAETGEGLGEVLLELSARDLRFDDSDVAVLALRAEGPRGAIAYDLHAEDLTAGPLFFTETDSTGKIDLDGQAMALDRLDLDLPGTGRTVALLAPTRLSWADGLRLSRTSISAPDGGTLTLDAALGEARWVADMTARGLRLPDMPVTAGFDLALDTDEAEVASFSLQAAGQPADDDPVVRLALDGTWDGRAVRFDTRLRQGEGPGGGEIAGILPLRLVRTPALSLELPRDGLDARLRFDDRVEPLYALTPLETRPFTGRLVADIHVFGDPLAPATEGTLTVSDGQLEDGEIGLALQNLGGTATFRVAPGGTSGEIEITGSGAEDRPGSVRLAGSISTTATDSAVDLSLVLDRAQVARSAELEILASSDLDLQGSLTDLTLSGPITIDELDLGIPDIENGDSAPTYVPVNVVLVDAPEAVARDDGEDGTDSPLTLRLDLSVNADNRIFIRGRGLNSEWSSRLRIGGTADDPRIAGTVNLRDGELRLAGRSFEITKGAISFAGDEIDPDLLIEAETEAGEAPDTVTAIAVIEGPASSPSLSFRSNPARPEDDVLALILFGRPAAELGAAEALQLAQAVATLTGTGPFGGAGGVVGAFRSGLGLDQLAIDAGSRALTVGKYISDDIYVSARQGIGTATTVISVVYEISRFFSLETTLQPTGAQTIGATYRRDY